jgi:hypothetical protein
VLLFENREFRLFKRVYQIDSFEGLIDVKLATAESSSSVIGVIQKETIFYSLPKLIFSFDFINYSYNTVNLNFNVTYLLNNISVTYVAASSNISAVRNNFTVIDYNFPYISNDTTNNNIFIQSIGIKYYYNLLEIQTIRDYMLKADFANYITLTSNNTDGMWVLRSGKGLSFLI